LPSVGHFILRNGRALRRRAHVMTQRFLHRLGR